MSGVQEPPGFIKSLRKYEKYYFFARKKNLYQFKLSSSETYRPDIHIGWNYIIWRVFRIKEMENDLLYLTQNLIFPT